MLVNTFIHNDDSCRRLEIDDKDFTAVFNGEQWVAKWKWKSQEPTLHNKCVEYSVSESKREDYEKELDQWINNG